MAPFERVLVGIGGSERHRDALALAQRLVDPEGELVLAHVDGGRSFPLPSAAESAAHTGAAAR